jgi:AcrR family transcriptional regulator
MKEGGAAVPTTNAIAERAGIPVGSIYQYFPNKGSIVAALYEEYLADIRQVVRDAIDADDDSLPVEDRLVYLLNQIQSAEQAGDMQIAFERAFAVSDELSKLDDLHQEQLVRMVTEYLKAMGSPMRKPKLSRLCMMTYEVSAASWRYREAAAPPEKEYLDWQMTVIKSLLWKAFPSRDTGDWVSV